jgi:hypothetical protein
LDWALLECEKAPRSQRAPRWSAVGTYSAGIFFSPNLENPMKSICV